MSMSPRHITLACVFTFFSIWLLALGAQWTGMRLLIPPFGASCVMLFLFPQGPFSTLKSLVGGHLMTSLIGLVFLFFLPDSMIALALAVSLGILAMILTKTLHPAAGGNPILIYLLKAPISFLLSPILIGTLFLAGMWWIYTRALKVS